MIDENKLQQIKQMIAAAEEALKAAKKLLEENDGIAEETAIESPNYVSEAKKVGKVSKAGRVIEGVFDGLNLISPEGKQYNVPANYASKSKLVEGDVLKLTIADDGSFVFKQIGPVERKRLIGALVQDEATDEYRVLANGKSYKVLLASITYFKGEIGDEAVILVPQDKSSTWAAVENIVKGGNLNKDIKEQQETETQSQEEDNLEDKKSKEDVDDLKI